MSSTFGENGSIFLNLGHPSLYDGYMLCKFQYAWRHLPWFRLQFPFGSGIVCHIHVHVLGARSISSSYGPGPPDHWFSLLWYRLKNKGVFKSLTLKNYCSVLSDETFAFLKQNIIPGSIHDNNRNEDVAKIWYVQNIFQDAFDTTSLHWDHKMHWLFHVA